MSAHTFFCTKATICLLRGIFLPLFFAWAGFHHFLLLFIRRPPPFGGPAAAALGASKKSLAEGAGNLRDPGFKAATLAGGPGRPRAVDGNGKRAGRRQSKAAGMRKWMESMVRSNSFRISFDTKNKRILERADT